MNHATEDQRSTAVRWGHFTFALLLLVIVVLGAWIFLSDIQQYARAVAAVNPLVLVAMLGLTLLFFGIRFVRWQYLLRRADVRLPARGSLLIYLASLVAMVTPAYIAELSRSLFIRRKFGTPIRVTVTVLFYDRLFDMAALGLLGAMATSQAWLRASMLLIAGATIPAGWAAIGLAQRAAVEPHVTTTLTRYSVVVVGLALSLAAWLAVGLLVGVAASGFEPTVGLAEGLDIYSRSTVMDGITFISTRVGDANNSAIVQLRRLDMTPDDALAVCSLVQLTSIGFGLLVGAGFSLACLWPPRRAVTSDHTVHFDQIVDEYADQFSDHIWEYLLERKVTMIAEALPTSDYNAPNGAPNHAPNGAPLGLDLGCGLGKQCLAMGRRGYRVFGIDSAGKLVSSAGKTGATVVNGNALRLPFGDASLDFVYTVGVLHHLDGTDGQAASCVEVMRVLKPNGLFLIHETNPRNPLFRFYMGYVFPVIKSIDMGTEWWIAPRFWNQIDGFTLVDVKYFTFLPDFIPRSLLRSLAPLERRLESTPLRRYSAHYMAILRKQPPTGVEDDN